jgi:hypothetical protein
MPASVVACRPTEFLPMRVVTWCCERGPGTRVEQGKGGKVAEGGRAAETVRVSVAELELVRHLLFAAGNLAVCVLESDAALVSDQVLEKARHLQAIFGELAG